MTARKGVMNLPKKSPASPRMHIKCRTNRLLERDKRKYEVMEMNEEDREYIADNYNTTTLAGFKMQRIVVTHTIRERDGMLTDTAMSPPNPLPILEALLYANDWAQKEGVRIVRVNIANTDVETASYERKETNFRKDE